MLLVAFFTSSQFSQMGSDYRNGCIHCIILEIRSLLFDLLKFTISYSFLFDGRMASISIITNFHVLRNDENNTLTRLCNIHVLRILWLLKSQFLDEQMYHFTNFRPKHRLQTHH